VSTISRSQRLALPVALLAALLLLVPAAFAAKGGGGGKPSGGGTTGAAISAPVMVTDVGTPGVSFGDTITFNVSTSASFPSVKLACYQSETLVYTSTRGFYPTYMWSDNYLLEGGNWSGGAASCTATLYTTSKNGSNITLATLSVPVSA